MNKPCSCEICKLAKACEGISKKCNKFEKSVLNEIWGRMECAETELSVQKHFSEKRQDILINKVRYTPK